MIACSLGTLSAGPGINVLETMCKADVGQIPGVPEADIRETFQASFSLRGSPSNRQGLVWRCSAVQQGMGAYHRARSMLDGGISQGTIYVT
jgi:hypothetical protein